LIQQYFRFAERGTNLRTEITAGITTFLTMAYILVVNPGILSQGTGMDFGAVFLATAISAGFSTLLMGLLANYPLALAPGMGLNAYFTYAVVGAMGVKWQVALGAVFISGVLFLILTLTKVRELIIDAIPRGLKHAISAGIGLFIAFIGFKDAGIIVADKATYVALGHFHDKTILLTIFCLAISLFFMVRKVRGGILLGMIITAIIGMLTGIIQPPTAIVSAPPSLAPTFMKLDIRGALDLGLFTIVFAFLFVDFFDNAGTLVGVATKAGLIQDNKLQNAKRVFLTDSIATIIGSLLGTSTVTSYIESASGVTEGGRTGFASVVTAILFFLSIFFFPIVKSIAVSPAVTAPVLIIVGSLMVTSLKEIDWSDFTEAVPAFLTILLMPLSFSIATGIALGFIVYPFMKLFKGEARKVHPIIYVLAILFIARFAFISV
jgi:AGZA family xanthine/uracil permease-like MFS transporter